MNSGIIFSARTHCKINKILKPHSRNSTGKYKSNKERETKMEMSVYLTIFLFVWFVYSCLYREKRTFEDVFMNSVEK